MKNIKKYLTAVAQISEKPLFVVIGLWGLWAYHTQGERSIKFALIAISATAFIFGIVPMMIAYFKSKWPKKDK